ncbi:mediator complex, subunit Med18 [Trichophaea hybrida]|nr:mediator complex, subunit Med18 [Trichophaea hybrida]
MSHFPNSHQELSLYAYIPTARQPQLLKILAGVSGMGAENYLQHHLIYRPTRPKPAPSTADHFYIQLVCRVDMPKTGNGDENGKQPAGANEYKPREQRWAMRLEDLPEVTRKPVVSRGIYSANTHQGDVLGFTESLGYTLQAPYFTDNFRFIHNNVIITLSQTLIPPTISEAGQAAEARAGNEVGDEIFGNPFPREALTLVDPGWTMQAAVRVQTNTDVENVNLGVNELRALKEVLKGVCDLDVVERLALDTRVK